MRYIALRQAVAIVTGAWAMGKVTAVSLALAIRLRRLPAQVQFMAQII